MAGGAGRGEEKTGVWFSRRASPPAKPDAAHPSKQIISCSSAGFRGAAGAGDEAVTYLLEIHPVGGADVELGAGVVGDDVGGGPSVGDDAVEAGLGAELLAEFLRVPPMLLLLGAGALLGPSVAGAIDVPLDSMGAELILTLGVSFILFHGGLQLSLTVLSRVVVGLLLLVIPGVVLTALLTGGVAAAVFGVPLTTGLLIGAALSPTDPAILIPLFERMRLRAKVAQTVIAESATLKAGQYQSW